MISLAPLLNEQGSLDFLIILLMISGLYWSFVVNLIPHVLSIVIVSDIVDNVVDCIVDYGDISLRLRRKVTRNDCSLRRLDDLLEFLLISVGNWSIFFC